jgi:hypothetical protein
MLEDLQAKQERELIVNGLQSILNPVIAKLMLSNHGYSRGYGPTVPCRRDQVSRRLDEHEPPNTADA